MTVTAQGLSPQGLTALGIGSQPGPFSPAFPAPIGAEQFLGIPQGYGSQPPIWQPSYPGQGVYGMPATYGQMPLVPGQTGYGGHASYGYTPFGLTPFGHTPSGFTPSGFTPSGFTQQSSGVAQPQQVQQLIGLLAGQILPVAQQMILPQVISMAVQAVQQLITQLAVPQLIGQPFWAQQAAPWLAPSPRPYAGLS